MIWIKVGNHNDQETAQSERNSHSKNGDEKIDNQVLILRNQIVSRVSSYSPIGGHSVTRKLKYENAQKVQIALKMPQQNKSIRTTTEVSQ